MILMKGLLGAGLILLWACPSGKAATDNELFAAYCMGVRRAQLEFLKNARVSDIAVFETAKREAWNKRHQEWERLRAYLLARGSFDAKSDDFGVPVAEKAEYTDLMTLVGSTSSDPCLAKCKSLVSEAIECSSVADFNHTCINEHVARRKACSDACIDANPLHVKIMRCDDTSRLPF
jgi:hypothetical protein